jgi:hypothetical protein
MYSAPAALPVNQEEAACGSFPYHLNEEPLQEAFSGDGGFFLVFSINLNSAGPVVGKKKIINYLIF